MMYKANEMRAIQHRLSTEVHTTNPADMSVVSAAVAIISEYACLVEAAGGFDFDRMRCDYANCQSNIHNLRKEMSLKQAQVCEEGRLKREAFGIIKRIGNAVKDVSVETHNECAKCVGFVKDIISDAEKKLA